MLHKVKRSAATACLVAMALTMVPAPSGAAAPTGIAYTGEEIFRGVIFGQGDVANLFPELWAKPHQMLERSLERSDNPEERRAQIEREVDLVISTIWTQDPAFFGRFEENVTSGDHLVVREALFEGAQLMMDVFNGTGLDGNNLGERPQSEGAGAFLWTENSVALANYAVVITYAALAVALIGVVFADYDIPFGDQDDRFRQEVIIDHITTRLAASS